MSETCQENGPKNISSQSKVTIKENDAGHKEVQECSSCVVTSHSLVDENMRRMMSFVEPLGHSQVVDRQSLASLPVGFVKLAITDDSKMLKVRLVDFMKTLTSKPSNNSTGKISSSSKTQVSIKGYLAVSNLVTESRVASSNTQDTTGKSNVLLFDKREIVAKVAKGIDQGCPNAKQLFNAEQILQVCVFVYPAPYRLKTFLGTVHLAIAEMRKSCNSNSVSLSSYYKIFPTSSFVAGCPVIGATHHCVNKCRHDNSVNRLDEMCERARANQVVAFKINNSGGQKKLKISKLASASASIPEEARPRCHTSSEEPSFHPHSKRITKSHSLRALVSALTHRKRLGNTMAKSKAYQTPASSPPRTQTTKLESEVSLDNGYGSSSGDSCSRTSESKFSDRQQQSFNESTRGPLCYRRSEPSFTASVTTTNSSCLVAQTSIDSTRSYADSTTTNSGETSERTSSVSQCICGTEYCSTIDRSTMSASTGAISANETTPRPRRKINTQITASSKVKSMQNIVSSMKNIVYSVRVRAKMNNKTREARMAKRKNVFPARPTTTVPPNLRSFSLGPLIDGSEDGFDVKDNVFEILNSASKIRCSEVTKKSSVSGSNFPSPLTSTEMDLTTSEAPTSSKASPPQSFDEGKGSSDDGIMFSVTEPRDSKETANWNCEECVIASLAENSQLKATASLKRNEQNLIQRSKLVRQNCFRSSDDVRKEKNKTANKDANILKLRQKHKLTKLKPVVDDDIAPYIEDGIAPRRSLEIQTTTEDDSEDFHSCAGGDLYVSDMISLSSSFHSLNCFVSGEDVCVR